MYRWMTAIGSAIQGNITTMIINIVDAKKHKFDMAYRMAIIYSDETKIDDIYQRVRKYLNKKYHPLQFGLIKVSGFVNDNIDSPDSNNTYLHSLTQYKIKDITQEPLRFFVKINYIHNIKMTITCDDMVKKGTNDPLQCPIYHALIKKNNTIKNIGIICLNLVILRMNSMINQNVNMGINVNHLYVKNKEIVMILKMNVI